MSWTPREIPLAQAVKDISNEIRWLEDAGEFDHVDELHRELWAARHELRQIREEIGE